MRKARIYRAAMIFLLLCAVSVSAGWQETAEKERQAAEAERWEQQEEQMRKRLSETPLYAGISAEFRAREIAEVVKNKDLLVAAAAMARHPEEEVYSFLQGPKSWGEGRTWSGEWSGKYVKGAYFGNFGCGLCCMANIYSTMTDYECSPWDMYEYARQVSGYSPTKKIAAIGWGDMKVTLRKCGFDCSLNTKPAAYEDFQKQMAEMKTAVVLVCSRDDDTYWTKTGGHYVNIWLYNEKTDEAFLADPGSPERNREWIPLRYVYDALKTASQYQYLLVNGYSEENNLWMHNGIDEAWVCPM